MSRMMDLTFSRFLTDDQNIRGSHAGEHVSEGQSQSMSSEMAGVVRNVLVVFGKNVGEVLSRKGRLGGAMVTALPACTLRGKAGAARLDLVTRQGSLGL